MSSQAASTPLPVVVLISGEGSNLQAILDQNRHSHALDIRAVISSRAEAHGLERARRAGIPAHALSANDYAERALFDAALVNTIEPYQPALIVLAGFMRILGDDFVHRYQRRLINIHPSLLPKYTGLNTHRRVLAAGETGHGCSVHFVTAALDGGPVIAQAPVPVLPDDDEHALRLRVQMREHRLYPQALNAFASGRVKLENETVLWDGQPLLKPKILAWNEDTLA